MTKIVAIRGNSGSGKTTLSNVLKEKLGDNAVVISQDVMKRTTGTHTQAAEISAMVISSVLKNQDKTIILDGIFRANKYRPLFTWLKRNFLIFGYYFDIPLSETLKRHQRRSNGSFGSTQIRIWYKHRDLLDVFEETIFDETTSTDSAASVILQDLAER